MKKDSKIFVLIVLCLFSGLAVHANGWADKNDTRPDTRPEENWALATLSVSNVRAQPDNAAELVTQVLLGTPLKVLKDSAGWVRILTPENYPGWMEESGLTHLTDEQLARWKKSDRYIYNRLDGHVFSLARSKSEPVSDLVLGDLFEVTSKVRGFYKIRFPDGRIGFVKKNECISWNDWINHKPDVESVLEIAKQLLGEPYLWGGTSTKAVDCSGLTKTAYYSQGIILERNASQQARCGNHPDFTNLKNLQPGDLLFFGRDARHIIHVGIYLGSGKYIHASGRVRINSIDPKDSLYNITETKKLVAASRVLNSLNTEGIWQVKDHPWYSLP